MFFKISFFPTNLITQYILLKLYYYNIIINIRIIILLR